MFLSCCCIVVSLWSWCFFTCKLLFHACKLVFYTRMLLFYVCKLFFYTRNLSFYICKLEEVWNSNVLIYIGQARWSQIVHTITSPPSLLRHHRISITVGCTTLGGIALEQPWVQRACVSVLWSGVKRDG